MQVMLSSPEITCEHCIETIRKTAEATGIAFVSGDPDARTFVVDIGGGEALGALATALADAGYPLGEITTSTASTHGALTPDWAPADYRVEKSDVGANVNYDCYCGCDAGFALDRTQADQAVESCCCGNQILVAPDASRQIGSKVDDASAYRIDVQTVTMPWGQPMEVALAIPRGG